MLLTQIIKFKTGLSGEANDLSGQSTHMGGVPLPPSPAGKWLTNWHMGRAALIHPRDSDPKKSQNKKTQICDSMNYLYMKEDPNNEINEKPIKKDHQGRN
jgi:hypothetical protein